MLATRLTPILNVSDIQQSFAWFEKLGWEKAWEWGTPTDFGGVCSGQCEIFLCENAQGSRGRSALTQTFGPEGNDAADKGAWMSIWVDNVDAVYEHCLEQGLEITWPPCRGMFARCTCDTRTVTYSESVKVSKSRTAAERRRR